MTQKHFKKHRFFGGENNEFPSVLNRQFARTDGKTEGAICQQIRVIPLLTADSAQKCAQPRDQFCAGKRLN
ncbi:hypothetical protein B2M26_06420 [Ferroacidibacillus organovorans]|uniref:Uncharacterized protein n=1 Tax=Ferroacidibacillus organovorans TaxID=1765683 RepID=A0A1V4EUR2_9BACL|nr:hypothetical protein B2M26_06420 [Ferroacidibacillus organovorans]